jgi:hypothetical protein
VTEEDLQPEDLELQRRLDAAFSQTSPRRGFEDLLWADLDARSRRRQRGPIPLLGWVPRDAWPALGVVAAVLVFLVAVVPLLVRGHSGSGASSGTAQVASPPGPTEVQRGPASGGATVLEPSAAFGSLPTPALSGPGQPQPAGAVVPYYGPAALSVIASVTSLPATLPVFRFAEPTTKQAATMAKAYHGRAVAPSRPFREPRFQLTVSSLDAGGAPLPDAAALAAADAFLAGKKLSWALSSVQEVVDQGPMAFVHYVRQFDVTGYGAASQVDQLGASAGADVAVRRDGKIYQVTVPMNLPLRSSAYPARAAQNAGQDAVNVPPPSPAGLTPAPQVQLSRADLVYIAVEAGAVGYFEPAVLFRGAFTSGGTQYEKRVLVPALDASQLR